MIPASCHACTSSPQCLTISSCQVEELGYHVNIYILFSYSGVNLDISFRNNALSPCACITSLFHMPVCSTTNKRWDLVEYFSPRGWSTTGFVLSVAGCFLVRAHQELLSSSSLFTLSHSSWRRAVCSFLMLICGYKPLPVSAQGAAINFVGNEDISPKWRSVSCPSCLTWAGGETKGSY